MGAVINTARLTPGSSAAVVGRGGVGLSAMLGALASGARWVAAIDMGSASPHRDIPRYLDLFRAGRLYQRGRGRCQDRDAGHPLPRAGAGHRAT